MKEITNGHPPIGTGLPASKPNSPRDPRRRFASMWSGAVSVAPASVLPNRTDEFYKTEEEALFAIADALHEEYSAVVESGLLVQIDDAFLASYYDVMVPPPAWKITANGRHYGSMRSITPCVVSPRAMPLSRLLGSWNGPHTNNVPLKDIADLIVRVNVAGYSLEMANRRHEHEWCVWETVKLPEGKMLLPGVIIHATNVIEHPEPVAQRLVRLARLVGSERVISSTDCGFAQGPFGRRGASLDHVGRLACAFRGSSDHEPDAWHARVLTPLCSDPFGRRRAFQIV